MAAVCTFAPRSLVSLALCAAAFSASFAADNPARAVTAAPAAAAAVPAPTTTAVERDAEILLVVLAPKRQDEVRAIVDALARFAPTFVGVEWPADIVEERYPKYLAGTLPESTP